jgi:hypothetical protein
MGNSTPGCGSRRAELSSGGMKCTHTACGFERVAPDGTGEAATARPHGLVFLFVDESEKRLRHSAPRRKS